MYVWMIRSAGFVLFLLRSIQAARPLSAGTQNVASDSGATDSDCPSHLNRTRAEARGSQYLQRDRIRAEIATEVDATEVATEIATEIATEEAKKDDKAACTTDQAYFKDQGNRKWIGKCMTLKECMDACTGGKCVFNWWPWTGGCRIYPDGSPGETTTDWPSIGGKPNCMYAGMDVPDCTKCPRKYWKEDGCWKNATRGFEKGGGNNAAEDPPEGDRRSLVAADSKGNVRCCKDNEEPSAFVKFRIISKDNEAPKCYTKDLLRMTKDFQTSFMKTEDFKGAMDVKLKEPDTKIGCKNLKGKTWCEAYAICKANNMRLCTREELLKLVDTGFGPGKEKKCLCYNTGCNFDQNVVWTSDNEETYQPSDGA